MPDRLNFLVVHVQACSLQREVAAQTCPKLRQFMSSQQCR